MKRYWLADFERKVMESMHQRKMEISSEVRTVMNRWAKNKPKAKIREFKKLITQAKKDHKAFSKVMRSLKKYGQSLMIIYQRSWSIFGQKPQVARSSFLTVMRNCL